MQWRNHCYQNLTQQTPSVPIYFSQSPFSLRPPPLLERTLQENQLALTAHFDNQFALYGRQVIVNLAEQIGNESVIVDAYRHGVKQMNEENDESLREISVK